MKSKTYFKEFVGYCREVINKAKEIDPSHEDAEQDIKRLSTINNAVKNANQVFKINLQNDLARARLDNYESSFLNEEDE